jgi:hypothetical protein
MQDAKMQDETKTMAALDKHKGRQAQRTIKQQNGSDKNRQQKTKERSSSSLTTLKLNEEKMEESTRTQQQIAGRG